MERYEQTGQYYNWYDHRTGAKLTIWPPTGNPLVPILSSVDNGWLAVGLRIVENSVPLLARRAGALYDADELRLLLPARRQPDPVPLRARHRAQRRAATTPWSARAGSPTTSASRAGRCRRRPTTAATARSPTRCDWAWTETKPVGSSATYFGVEVFEGALPYAGMKVVPSWSGSMFEALMPALFVPEERWAPRSWGENHPLTVRAQIHHGLVEAGYGYWGFSPANVPEGGYTVYGVDGIGSDPGGGASNNDKTLIDHGWEGCPDRPALPDPPPSAYTNGVVTPHAAFLALRYAPREALDNLRRLARDFPGLYGRWGFRDSVNVDSGVVSDAYLSLDQGMIMAALSNALSHDLLRRAFADRELERGLRPVIGVEEFGTSG